MANYASRFGRMNIDSNRSGIRKILIAVDFGTTYSAVAWAQPYRSAKNESPQSWTHIIDDWPEARSTEFKVPTTLSYQENSVKWGFELEPQDLKYEWFKLAQNPNLMRNGLAGEYPRTAIRPNDPAEVEKLITDYLKLLREYAEKTIRNSFEGLDSLFRDITWEYIITVPAVWPEAAQNTTLKCAEAAAMGDVRIITEPEAAGIYAIDSMSQEISLSKNDTFVICDAGGGTVDVISYTITATKPTPQLSESAAGSGDLCGSTFLDREFDAWLQKMSQGFHDWTTEHHNDAMARWESQIKRTFTGDTTRKYYIPARGIRDTPALGIKDGKIELSGKTVIKLFDVVVNKIIRLVQDQVKETEKNARSVKAVLLAGGFGRNEYLKRRIKATVGQSIKVERMKECTTAIVRGALIRGVAGNTPNAQRPNIWVESRVSRKHYGTSALTAFDPSRHSSSRPRVDPGVDGATRIEVMHWFIPKGGSIKESTPAYFQYYYDQLASDVQFRGGRFEEVAMPIYTCDYDKPPLYPELGSTGSCKTLGTLIADLNKIPKADLETTTLNGQTYYNIPFKIEMTVHSARLTFNVVHEKIRGGSVQRLECGTGRFEYA